MKEQTVPLTSAPDFAEKPPGLSVSYRRAGLYSLLAGGLLGLSGLFSAPVAQTAFDVSERPEKTRTVAVTFDDLPVAYTQDFPERKQITADLLDQIIRWDLPAVGFVNEGKLHDTESKLQPSEVDLLKAWGDAGLELANHTYSHDRFEETPLEEFKEDVLRGEQVTRRIMEERGMQLRYFRHPFLNIGEDTDKIAEFNEFLADHDYIIAPVTVGNRDWYYNAAYVNALREGENEIAEKVVENYLRYTAESFLHAEQLTEQVLDREPAQILLLHANRIHADHLDRLLELIEELGYEIVTLDRAMRDEAYRKPGVHNDPYTLRGLYRVWKNKTGESLAARPTVPVWLKEWAGPAPESPW